MNDENSQPQQQPQPQPRPIPLLKPPPPELFQAFSSSSSSSSKQNNISPNSWDGNGLLNALNSPMESSEDYIAKLEAKLSKGMKVPPPKLAMKLQEERERKIFNGELSDDEKEEEENSCESDNAILLSNVKPLNNEKVNTVINDGDNDNESSQPILTKEEKESYLNDDDDDKIYNKDNTEENMNNNEKTKENANDNADEESNKCCKLCIIP